jgi:hypothetical protein
VGKSRVSNFLRLSRFNFHGNQKRDHRFPVAASDRQIDLLNGSGIKQPFVDSDLSPGISSKNE